MAWAWFTSLFSEVKMDTERLVQNSNRVFGALAEHVGILEACVAGDIRMARERLSNHLDIAMSRAIGGL